jgi:hypothetical protein
MPARFKPHHDDDDTPLVKVTGGEFIVLTTITTDENLMNEMHSRFTQLLSQLTEYAQEQMYLYFPSQPTITYKVTKLDNYEMRPHQP